MNLDSPLWRQASRLPGGGLLRELLRRARGSRSPVRRVAEDGSAGVPPAGGGWRTIRRLVASRRLRLALAALALACVLAPLLLAAWRSSLVAPPPTLLLRDRHGELLGEVGGSDEHGFGYWPLGELPPRVVAATLAVEDRHFRLHPGVDPLAVARALRQNLGSGRRVSGASTLAMQVARLQHPGTRTLPRKTVEALTALLLTARNGRDAVLRHYLEIVPYGNQAHGIAYAARRYLDKPVSDLSWAEVAFLTAIPQAPGRMNPFDPAGRLRTVERGERILELLHRDGELDDTELELARSQLHTLHPPPRGERQDCAMHAVLALGAMLADKRDVGPVVTTTLDLDLQREVSWQVLAAASKWERHGAGNAAAVVLDPASREVLAWVGSSDYFDTRHAGAIDYVRVPRSPGSTLKPFVYALALERGVITPATVLDDLARGAGGIANADQRFLGPLLPRVALATSRNVPAADLLAAVGLDTGYGFLADLGLHGSPLPARHFGLGLAIGGMPVTLEQLARAYTVLSGDGRLGDLVWYRGQKSAPPRRVLSEETARLVTLFLSDPMARLPEFPRLGNLEYPFPVAVKTGTSSNYHDGWTVAYSRRYLVAAWVGHPDFRPMSRLSGYRSAARLVQTILVGLHPAEADGLGDVGFPPPRGFLPVRLCALSGKLATPACDRAVLEYFRPGLEPSEPCRAHVALAVDRATGALASPATPRDQVEVRTFVDLGPRYAEWQADAGLPHPPGPAQDASARRELRPRLAGTQPVRLHITEPEPDLRLLRDPETPVAQATLALRATVDPPAPQVVWYVDGAPYQVADYPYTTRWRLTPGEHRFQARLPYQDERSQVVSVKVE